MFPLYVRNAPDRNDFEPNIAAKNGQLDENVSCSRQGITTGVERGPLCISFPMALKDESRKTHERISHNESGFRP